MPSVRTTTTTSGNSDDRENQWVALIEHAHRDFYSRAYVLARASALCEQSTRRGLGDQAIGLSFSDKINLALDKSLIDGGQASILHSLRKLRHEFIHEATIPTLAETARLLPAVAAIDLQLMGRQANVMYLRAVREACERNPGTVYTNSRKLHRLDGGPLAELLARSALPEERICGLLLACSYAVHEAEHRIYPRGKADWPGGNKHPTAQRVLLACQQVRATPPNELQDIIKLRNEHAHHGRLDPTQDAPSAQVASSHVRTMLSLAESLAPAHRGKPARRVVPRASNTDAERELTALQERLRQSEQRIKETQQRASDQAQAASREAQAYKEMLEQNLVGLRQDNLLADYERRRSALSDRLVTRAEEGRRTRMNQFLPWVAIPAMLFAGVLVVSLSGGVFGSLAALVNGAGVACAAGCFSPGAAFAGARMMAYGGALGVLASGAAMVGCLLFPVIPGVLRQGFLSLQIARLNAEFMARAPTEAHERIFGLDRDFRATEEEAQAHLPDDSGLVTSVGTALSAGLCALSVVLGLAQGALAGGMPQPTQASDQPAPKPTSQDIQVRWEATRLAEAKDFSTTDASSELSTADRNNYSVSRLFDGQRNSAWCEGVPGFGAGSWFRLRFREPVRLEKLTMSTGFAHISKTEGDLFLRNAHAQTVVLEVDGAKMAPHSVSRDQRELELTGPDRPVQEVRVIIQDVWPSQPVGALRAFNDLCINEASVRIASPAAGSQDARAHTVPVRAPAPAPAPSPASPPGGCTCK